MAKYYIGLANSFHDPAIAIVNEDGEVVFAEATERYLQNKRARGCVADNRFWIEKLLAEYCDPQGEFVVAKTWSKGHRRILKFLNLLGFLEHEKIPSRSDKLTEFFITHHELLSVSALQHSCQMQSGGHLVDVLRAKHNNNKVTYRNYPHHLCHAATGCYGSSYSNASCMVVDGQGEGGSITFFKYSGGKLELAHQNKSPASLGILYMMATKYCGFDPDKGEEWKVMGLAPYGKLDETLLTEYRDLIQLDGLSMKYRSLNQVKKCLAMLQKRFNYGDISTEERADLAYTTQFFYAETVTKLLNNFYGIAPSENLVISGGCGLNSSYNGQIVERTPFKNAYIPSAPADDGNAVGAALLSWVEDGGKPRQSRTILSPYLGSQVSKQTLQDVRSFSRTPKLHELPGTVHEAAANLLAEGKIIGWVQGRAEFGPRALGNRSILADPRSPEMKDKINATVKFREEFRPFAPAILHEFGPDYFESYQETPYMERTLRFKPEAREKVPAVVHVDGTGRLQTVKKEWNEKYHALITAFFKITGVPIILNTSFNIMGKPIIHSVEDAISVFFTTGLDALVIEDYLIEK